jgi:hypothetical protein
MNTFELLYLPPEVSKHAISSAITRRLREFGKNRFHYRHSPATGLGCIDVQSLAPKHTQHKYGLQITVSPAALVHGRGAFSALAGAALTKPLMGEISRAVHACLDLDEDSLQIDVEHLTLVRGTMELCFLLESENAAIAALMDVAHHIKVVKDLASPMPSKSWKVAKRQPPLVRWSADHKRVIEVELAFGNARIFLADASRSAALLGGSSEEAIEAGKALGRSMLCVEVTADIASVTDPADPTATLPVRLDRWFGSVMKINPYAFIWNAFLWECWLNEDFSNADTDFDTFELADDPRELLNHYLLGGFYRDSAVIRDDHGRFLAFRHALIVKAGVDLLNPWRNFRLNKAQALRPLLAFDTRFKPETHPILSALTLTATTALEHGAVLDAAAGTKPGRGEWA